MFDQLPKCEDKFPLNQLSYNLVNSHVYLVKWQPITITAVYGKTFKRETFTVLKVFYSTVNALWLTLKEAEFPMNV